MPDRPDHGDRYGGEILRLLRAACLAVAAALLPATATAADLGRLFLTPEQRSSLDARRKARIPDKAATAEIESPVTRLDGYVSRGGGKSTTWVNGEPVPEGSQPQGLRLTPRRSDASRVTVDVVEGENRVDLKIGQSFDRKSGEVRDSLDDGEIKINRRPAPRPAK